MGQTYCLECRRGGAVKVLFINDSSSNPNWGDRAAAIALKSMIQAKGGTLHAVITEDDLAESRFFQPIDESICSEAPKRSLKDWARLVTPPVIPKLWQKLYGLSGNQEEQGCIPRTLSQFEECADLVLKDSDTYAPLVDAVRSSDLVLIHGDGCMVGNGLLPRSELFLAYLAKTRFSTPVALINHTTDFSHPDLDEMASAVYPLLDDVTYRDETSASLCKDRWPGRYAADTAFLFEPAEKAQWAPLANRSTYFDVWPDQAAFNPDKPYLCIGGSSIYSFDGPVQDYIEGFKRLADSLRDSYDGQVVLTASDIKDQTLFRPVARELGLPLVGLTTPVQQVVDILGNAQAYVGGRWHPSIFALRGGTPVIPLSSKTFKMQALIAMASLPTTTFDSLNLAEEAEAIGHTLQEFLRQGDELRRQVKSWAQVQAKSSWDNVAILSPDFPSSSSKGLLQ